MCSGNLEKSLKSKTKKKILSVKFEVKITKSKTFRIFIDSTRASYNSDNAKNIFRMRLVRDGFLFVLCEILQINEL